MGHPQVAGPPAAPRVGGSEDHLASRLGLLPLEKLRWCERHAIHYAVRPAKNARLLLQAQELMAKAADGFAATAEKQRNFCWIEYAAKSWDRPRTVTLKPEHGAQGANPRFLLSDLEGHAQHIYDAIYRARGEMENRIKEQQLGLFADRTSCSGWWANQFRLLLSGALRALGNHPARGTSWHRAGPCTGEHDPIEALEDWCSHPAQYTPHSVALLRRLCLPGNLPLHAAALEFGLKPLGADPGTIKTTGAGVNLPKIRKITLPRPPNPLSESPEPYRKTKSSKNKISGLEMKAAINWGVSLSAPTHFHPLLDQAPDRAGSPQVGN